MKKEKPRKIIFDLYFDEAPIFYKVAEEIQQLFGIEVIGVTLGKRWNNIIKNPKIKLYNMSDFFNKNWSSINITGKIIKEYERKYGNPFNSNIILADRFFSNYFFYKYNWKYSTKYLILSFKFWEFLVKKEKLCSSDIFVLPGVAFLPHLTCQKVAQKEKVNFFSLYVSPFTNNNFLISHGINNFYPLLQKNYNNYLKINLTKKEDEEIELFLNNFKKKEIKPEYMKAIIQKKMVTPWHIKWFSLRFYYYYFLGWKKDKFDFITLNPFWYAFRDLRMVVKAQIMNLFYKFDKVGKEEEYIFFPLHLQPEASTLILGSYYVDQIALIENIAKSIPLDYKLYVKEHISALGKRDSGYYKKIKKIPNVKLISPYENSHELIKRSKAVIVITSTVGLEGLIYEKPVIVLGDTFYNISDLTYQIKGIKELPGVLESILEEDFQIDKLKLKKFILSLLHSSHKGNIYVPHVSGVKTLIQENIKNISFGIVDEYQKIS
jgi:hypothetical protein